MNVFIITLGNSAVWENFVGDNNITIKQSVSNQPKCKDLLVARLQEVLVVYKN